MNGVYLTGLGVAAPHAHLDQETSISLAQARCCTTQRQRNWLRRVYRHSGIRRRGSVLLGADGAHGFETFYPLPEIVGERGPTTAARLQCYEATVAPLADAACRAALDEAATEPDTITHLVTVTCTGMVSPGLDVQLVQRLGLSPDIGRLNLGFMGCHGALNGLRATSGLVQDGRNARVLLCCVELCSLHFQYGFEPQKVIANGLFADGAGAAILDLGGEKSSGWRMIDTRSRLAPDSEQAMTWRIGDHGFEMTLSSTVPRLILGSLREWTQAWLAEQGMTLGDVRHWAIHPGGPEILRAATRALALPDDAARTSYEVLAEHGNMSSPTVLFILERLRAQGARGPCVVMGFGPGLSLEAALLEP